MAAKSKPVKASAIRICFAHLVALLLFAAPSVGQQQGRVVINEYMPWTSNACGVPTEFVELMNFGPGPVDIGCYVLTSGVYSITIPPNTVLRAGEFYVIAGQSFLPDRCANVDSLGTGVTADLNWNNCNCTNLPIPSANSSDGFLPDNGTSPLVLLDPSLTPIDAVIRSLPGAPTNTITSSTISGACASNTFNIGTMGLSFEELGMAPGNQNSFARSMDGDCNWVKQPNQSANASNNKSGSGTDISYELDMVKPTSCSGSGGGSVSIYVKHSNYASVFPMGYIISTDVNNDGVFDFNDQYQTFTDDSPPFVEIDNLPVGRYRLTVFSAKGCYLETFNFPIIPCDPNTLPARLRYFRNSGTTQNQHHLEWLVQDVQNLQSIVVQKAGADGKFSTDKIFTNDPHRGDKLYKYAVDAAPSTAYLRLKMTQKNGGVFYSPVVSTVNGRSPQPPRIGPNPATDKLTLQLTSLSAQKAVYTIYNASGLSVKTSTLTLNKGENATDIPLQGLLPGAYQLQISGVAGEKQPISLRFVKH